MNRNPLFLIAAIFNFIVGVSFLAAYPWVSRLLGFEASPDVFFHIVAGLVLLFGALYWLIWRNPVRFRLFIPLGAVAKLIFVIAIYAHWILGSTSGLLALLVSADLVFAILFFYVYRELR